MRRVLRSAVGALLAQNSEQTTWEATQAMLETVEGGAAFVDRCQAVSRRFLDIAFKHARLQGRPGTLLRTVVELAGRGEQYLAAAEHDSHESSGRLLDRLKAAVGPAREAEAVDVVETARVSWRLRDDDNVLVARIESQLLRALEVAAERFRAAGRLTATRQPDERDTGMIVEGLRDK